MAAQKLAADFTYLQLPAVTSARPTSKEFLKEGDAGKQIPAKLSLLGAKVWLLSAKETTFTLST